MNLLQSLQTAKLAELPWLDYREGKEFYHKLDLINHLEECI
jgi:hypothetical protein